MTSNTSKEERVGGNNILDKSAMETIAKMDKELAVLTSRVEALPDVVNDLKIEVGKMSERVSTLNTRIEEEPLRCPYRDQVGDLTSRMKPIEGCVDELESRVGKAETDIARLSTEVKWLGGLNAIYTTIATAVANVIKGP